MYRDPARFPQHARLAAVQTEAQAAISFMRFLNDNRLHICTEDADGGYTFAGIDTDRHILAWLGVDVQAFLQEGRDIAAETAAEQVELVRAAAAAPLAPPPEHDG